MSDRVLQYLAPLGRLLLASIFLASGAAKLMDWQQPLRMMIDKGLPAANILLSIAVALEIIGGLSVLLGIQARFGALALLVFLAPVTAIMHDFWAYQGAEQVAQMTNFMKNVSIAGGVLLVIAFGAGPMSFDRLFTRPPQPPPVA